MTQAKDKKAVKQIERSIDRALDGMGYKKVKGKERGPITTDVVVDVIREMQKPINGAFDYKRFGKEIYEKRVANDTTFDKLSKSTKLNKASWHRAESGTIVSLDSIVIICNWLGKPVQSFLTK
jgi:hypothetical protein